MKILRTPDERFVDLPDFPFKPHYLKIPFGEGSSIRMHYLDEGPAHGQPVLLIHGEPSWSFLYRKMIPGLVEAGLRAVVPDLIGFGRSDKLANRSEYSYQRYVDWTMYFIRAIELENITLFGQDWGGLIGLRLAAENGERFSRIVAANTGLPTGDQKMPEAFTRWQQFSQKAKSFSISRVVNGGTVSNLNSLVRAAYDAPFPDDSFKEAARVFPALVPTSPDDPSAPANRRAWEALQKWEKPFLTAFSDSDPITSRGELIFQRMVPGAKGMPHTKVNNAGHFLQEDKGEQLASIVVDFIEKYPSR